MINKVIGPTNIYYNREMMPKLGPSKLSDAHVTSIIDAENSRKEEAQKAELESLVQMRDSFLDRIVDAFDYQEGIIKKVEKVSNFIGMIIAEDSRAAEKNINDAVSDSITKHATRHKFMVDEILKANMKPAQELNPTKKLELIKELSEAKRNIEANVYAIDVLKKANDKIEDKFREKNEIKPRENIEKGYDILKNEQLQSKVNNLEFNKEQERLGINKEILKKQKLEEIFDQRDRLVVLKDRLDVVIEDIKENRLDKVKVEVKEILSSFEEFEKEIPYPQVQNYDRNGASKSVYTHDYFISFTV